MEHILRPIYQERASQSDTLGVILVTKREETMSVTDTFDAVLLIVVKDADMPIFTKHYLHEDKKMAMHVITEELLNKRLNVGLDRRIVDWIFHGKVMFDRNEYLSDLRLKLQEFPFLGRKLKTGIQFSKLIRRYLEGKEFFNRGNYFDSYHHVVDSLHHLARLAVIENGLYPEVTVWSQVKKLEPSIYKLYEELVMSTESLEKRLELLFLAIEFLINSRTHDGAQHILETMLSKDTWTTQELHNHNELKYYSKDLEVFVEYLIDKGYIIAEAELSKSGLIYHRHYKVDKEFAASAYE
ncbi:nucleotidyltransferase-like protein [Lysinibacillus fusiformis]|nr:nucleotidyltransferase-like protein [Lysinibacillus fusiformis]